MSNRLVEELETLIAETEPKSLERLQVILDWAFARYSYVSDQKKFGQSEWWASARKELLDTGSFTGDCDTYAATMFHLIRKYGGWDLSEIAMVLSRPVKRSRTKYTHALGAVFIDNTWLYFQCWNTKVLSQWTLDNDKQHYQHLAAHRLLHWGNDAKGEPKWNAGPAPW